MANRTQILVTGGGTFLGNHIAAALLAEGANVMLLARPGAEDQLGKLRTQLEWRSADVWNPASLKGRARHARTVVHTVGSMRAEPSQGLTHLYLNFLSARNVANMCVTDGAQQMVLLSSASALWLDRRYIAAKRTAEQYVNRVGLQATVIRAPVVYVRGKSRPPLYQIVSIVGAATPFFGRSAPLPADVLARAVARAALDPQRDLYFRRHLVQLNTRAERRGQPEPQPTVPPINIPEPPPHEHDTKPTFPVQ